VSGRREPPVRGNSRGAIALGLVHRIEALEQEIKGLNSDKRDVYAEGKAKGIDPAAIRDLIAYRRDPAKAEQRSEARDELLRMIEDAERGAAPRARPALPAPGAGITLTPDGMPDATRVHAHEAEGEQ